MIGPVRLNQKSILFLSVAFFGAVYTVQVVMNHYLMRTFALDYGFYNQAFWDFAHFRANYNTVLGPQINYFQVHPGFTLLILSPLYHLFNPLFGTYSLLIIQNFFILAGGYCVYLLIYSKTGNFWVAFLAFVHFNLVWGYYCARAGDFIEATVGASTVPVFLLFFDRRKYLFASVIFLFVLACKENMPIWFIFISLWLIVVYKDHKSRWLATGYLLISLLYLVFLFRIVIPFFEDPEMPYWSFAYSSLGADPWEAAVFVIKHPFETFRMLFVNHLNDPAYDFIKKEFYIVFLLSGGILLFRRPVYILPFIPVIAQKMFNDRVGHWGISGFYSVEVVSILTVFAFLATIDIKNSIYRYALYGCLCISTLFITLNKMDHRRDLWYDRSKEAITRCDFYKSELDVRKIRKQIRKIVPDESPLVATQSVVPHFSQRDKVRIFPYVQDAVYMVLLKDGKPYPLTQDAFDKEWDRYFNDPAWVILLDDHPLRILKKIR